MKKLLSMVMVFGLVSSLAVMAQEVKPGKVEIIDLGNDVKLEMVLIPAGKFIMGSPASEKGRDKEERQHEVTITYPFYIGKYEVTQEQWKAVMGNNPSNTKGAKLPVTQLSWKACQEFVEKLNVKTNGGYRLPTEAEWEYACRAGTQTAFAFGDDLTDLHAKFCKNKAASAQPRSLVGIYPPNAWGLHDMHGNVWEWCEDWYGDYPAWAVTDPRGPGTGTHHVIRGGSASLLANECRSAIRGEAKLDRPNSVGKWRFEIYGDFGFRLAKTK